MSDITNLGPEELDEVNGGRRVRPEDQKRLEELKNQYYEALNNNQPNTQELYSAYQKQREKLRIRYPGQF